MNELASILDDSVTRLLTDLSTREVVEEAEAGRWPEALWRALEDHGLTRPLVPEDAGGVGASWEDARVLLRAAGRHAAPVPLAETILASWLCARAGIEAPEGVLTVGCARGARLDREDRLRGEFLRVPWGRAATHVVFGASEGGSTRLAVASTRDAEIVEDGNLAREPRDALRFDGAPVVASAPLPSDLSADPVRLCGALARSLQMVGALERLLEESVQFANDRVQFGRPIGKFQAIQHSLAVLASETAAAGAAADVACRAVGRGDAGFEIAVAKVRAGEAAGIGAKIAHQVHGAIGFTYEHALHFATRRLWSWRAEFGSEGEWSEQLGLDAIRRGGGALWPFVTAR